MTSNHELIEGIVLVWLTLTNFIPSANFLQHYNRYQLVTLQRFVVVKGQTQL